MYKYLILLIVTLGLLLRLNNIFSRSLWTDEFFTFFDATGHGGIQHYLNSFSKQDIPPVFEAWQIKAFLKLDPSRGISKVSEALLIEDTHPPVYFWTMHYWMRLLGDNQSSARAFSLLMGLLSIWLVYLVGKHLFDESIALFSALFVSLNPFAVRMSQEARSYTLVMVLILLSWLILLRIRQGKGNFNIIALSIVNSLGVLTHYFFALILFGELIYCAFVLRKDKVLLNSFYKSFLLSLLMILFWIIPVARHGYNYILVQWPFGFSGFWNKFYYACVGLNSYFYVIFPRRASRGEEMILVAGFIITLISLATKSLWKRYPRQLIFCLLMFFVPLVILLFLDLTLRGILLEQERFWAFSFLGFAFLGGCLLQWLFVRIRKMFFLATVTLFALSLYAAKLNFGPAPFGVSEWINAQAKGKTAAVFVWNIRCVAVAQAYYLDDKMLFIPVADNNQLAGVVRSLYGQVDKIFLVRHFNRADPVLMDKGEMNLGKEGERLFRLARIIDKDDIRVYMYEKVKALAGLRE